MLDAPAGSPYNRDCSRRRGVEGRADAVVLPGSAEEVRGGASRWCYEHDVPIMPRGGGTGLAGGAVPTEGGVVCSLERLRAVRELEPALWRMFAEAGVHTRDVQRLARENGLFFAPDPGASEQSQIGGNVATNAGGPHALKYGVTGAWVAGLEVGARAGRARASIGGWAAKDVAGYDLRSLLIGSEGTLGVITAVRLRLLPAPEAAIALVVFLRTRAEGCAAIEQCSRAGLRPSVLDFLDGEALALLAGCYPVERGSAAGSPRRRGLRADRRGGRQRARRPRPSARRSGLLEGRRSRIEEPRRPRGAVALARRRQRRAHGGAGGEGQRGRRVPARAAASRGSSASSRSPPRHGLRSCSFGHGGEGNVHATVLVDPARGGGARRGRGGRRGAVRARRRARRLDRRRARRGLAEAGSLRVPVAARAVELHEQIKRAFDPKGLFNPGKKLARYPARSPLTHT